MLYLQRENHRGTLAELPKWFASINALNNIKYWAHKMAKKPARAGDAKKPTKTERRPFPKERSSSQRGQEQKIQTFWYNPTTIHPNNIYNSTRAKNRPKVPWSGDKGHQRRQQAAPIPICSLPRTATDEIEAVWLQQRMRSKPCDYGNGRYRSHVITATDEIEADGDSIGYWLKSFAAA